MAQKLWEKSVQVNKDIERFTVGRDREMDLYLAKHDVLGSMAHITMLESIGLLTKEELDEDYEKNTGKVIIETFTNRGIDPVAVPGVICHSHGPFTWGKDAAQAVYHAVVLEEVAKMALLTCQINPNAEPAPQHVLDKHFMRKHGPNAYYGQKK